MGKVKAMRVQLTDVCDPYLLGRPPLHEEQARRTDQRQP
jgi:hypothetical protein